MSDNTKRIGSEGSTLIWNHVADVCACFPTATDFRTSAVQTMADRAICPTFPKSDNCSHGFY
jgi:hypothetical protein